VNRPVLEIPSRKALQISAVYAVVAALWIILSDRVIGLFVSDIDSCLWLQTAKGWFYVLATTILLFLLIWRGLHSFQRYEEEIRQRDDALRQSQKMEAVGRLAGGVAHDFNNHLMVIAGYTQLLKDRFGDDPQADKDFQQIQQACESATRLTEQLLTFSRKHTLKAEVVDLNGVVEASQQMLRRLIGENVIVHLNLAEHSCPIEIDPVQLEQIIMNLVVNARDAMPKGGNLRLSTYVVPESQLPSDGLQGPQVLFEVSDDGMGISDEVLPHIFEPFYTTKQAGSGTGLGLATVYGIVEQAGGRIEVKSEKERGTTFSIWFPLVDRPPQWKPSKTMVSRSLLPGGVVLLVEDEARVAEFTKQVLESAGLKVLCAEDGDEALELARTHPGEIDLLMADVVLPHVGGPELASRLRREHPGLKVLFMSGYAEKELLEGEGDEIVLLQKPASPSQILDAVAELLSEEEKPVEKNS